jgi:hypothetical protein
MMQAVVSGVTLSVTPNEALLAGFFWREQIVAEDHVTGWGER